MASKKKNTSRHKKGARSNSKSASVSPDLNKPRGMIEALADQSVRTRDFSTRDQVEQNGAAEVEGSSPIAAAANRSIKNEESGGIEFQSEASTLRIKESIYYPTELQYILVTVDTRRHINELTAQLTTRIIDASAELSFKNIDALNESMKTYMRYVNEMVASESMPVNNLIFDITTNIQALKNSLLNTTETSNDFSNISLNVSNILMS